MADEYVVTVKANTKPAEEGLNTFADNFSQAITGVNQGLELADKIARKLKETFDKIIDTAILGESIDAVGKRFDIFAKQAGQVPDNIAKGIARAVDGTVSMDDALKAASKTFVELDGQGNKIPAMFETARKAAQAFGGDTVSIFEDITKAIATGSTKALRQSSGLVINASEAYKTYANEIGKSVDKLSEAQKQEAIANEILTQSAKVYKNIDGSITPLNESLTRNKVAWQDLHESTAQLFNDTFGAMITNITNKMTSFVSKWAEFNNMSRSNSIPQTSSDIEVLSQKLTRLSEMQVSNPNLAGFYQKQIDEITAKLQLYQPVQDSANASTDTAVKTHSAASAAIIEHIYSLGELRSAQAAYEEQVLSSQTATQQFVSGASAGMRSLGKSMAELGKTASTTLFMGFVNGFAAVGAALVNGGNAFDAFGKEALKALGAIAIQIGTFLILAGLGFSVIPGFQASAAAIPEGIALIILGGALQALGGGGVGSAAAASASSGGATPTTSVDQQNQQDMFQTPAEAERAKAQTGVTINVQGNILDRRETGLELAAIINSAFDNNGVMIRANA